LKNKNIVSGVVPVDQSWVQYFDSILAHVSLLIVIDKFLMIRTVITASNLNRFPTNIFVYDLTLLASQRKFGNLIFLHP